VETEVPREKSKAGKANK